MKPDPNEVGNSVIKPLLNNAQLKAILDARIRAINDLYDNNNPQALMAIGSAILALKELL